jgi:hypothetical protein
MALDKEDMEDLKETISTIILFYKTVWSEVEKQFSELPPEERQKIFSVIAPSITQILNMIPDGYDTQETKPKRRNRQRKKR